MPLLRVSYSPEYLWPLRLRVLGKSSSFFGGKTSNEKTVLFFWNNDSIIIPPIVEIDLILILGYRNMILVFAQYYEILEQILEKHRQERCAIAWQR